MRWKAVVWVGLLCVGVLGLAAEGAQPKPKELPQLRLEETKLSVGAPQFAREIEEGSLRLYPDGTVGRSKFRANDNATLVLYSVTIVSPKPGELVLTEHVWCVRNGRGQSRAAVGIDPGKGDGWAIPGEGAMAFIPVRFETPGSKATIRLSFAVPKEKDWGVENLQLCLAVPLTTFNGGNHITPNSAPFAPPQNESEPGFADTRPRYAA